MERLYEDNKFLILMILLDAVILGYANIADLSVIALGFLLLVVSPLVSGGILWAGRRLRQKSAGLSR